MAAEHAAKGITSFGGPSSGGAMVLGTNETNAIGLTKEQQYAPPPAKKLEEAGDLVILDEEARPMPFKNLYTYGSGNGRQLIVFIRHFFCGSCEDYVRALSKHFSPKSLESLNPPTTLTIIGCGQPSTIPAYKTRTNCPFEIYCDPSRSVYTKLGMIQNLNTGDKKGSYIQSSAIGGTLSSMANMIKSGTKIWSGGDFRQNGGEWVFEQGELKWCHRMRGTGDHAEVKELKALLGMQ